MEQTDLDGLPEGIAIVGMDCRFPGSNNIEEFWQGIRDGVEAISFFTPEELVAAGVDPEVVARPDYIRAGAVLRDIDLFDAPFFGYTPLEAEIMDPQQRLFLEASWHALEHAGYDPETYEGLIGVYVGASDKDYPLHVYAHPDIVEALGENLITFSNSCDFISTRVSYKLNLKGPSLTVRTACSSSLVAVHLACQSLLTYQCDMTLAGGITVVPEPNVGYIQQPGGILSPDGHCRTFDAEAQGPVYGDGLGVVVLKRLEDALHDGDTIYAVIKGGAVNNDGSARVGYTAPSVDGQAGVIMTAQALAQVDPSTITYVEAHGTGTALGDPVEVAALTRAFCVHTNKIGYCAIGSVKTNIGHLDHAAGIAGFIKTCLMLHHKMLVPSLNFHRPNPQIDFTHSPFYVNTQLKPWQANDHVRRAGVSAFGIGGTNAHIILEEAPQEKPTSSSHSWYLLTLSARTPALLDEMTENLARHISSHSEQHLADIAYTLQVGRRQFAYRRAFVCSDDASALAALRGKDTSHPFTYVRTEEEKPTVVFLFPGQGAQYAGMAADLYREEPIFRQHLDRCVQLLTEILGEDLLPLLFNRDQRISERLQQPRIAHPALFVFEYALAQLWMAWNVQPGAMLGYGPGEYVAACLAGVFTLEEGLRLATARGRALQYAATGHVLTIEQAASQVRPLLTEGLSLIAVNSATQCVVAGSPAHLISLQNRLTTQGVHSQLHKNSRAFYTDLEEAQLRAFRQEVQSCALRAPTRPFISNLTGTWISAEEATDVEYWMRQLQQTIDFAAGVQTALQQPRALLLEVGPGQTLKHLVQPSTEAAMTQTLLSTLQPGEERVADSAFLQQTLGQLWMAGVAIDWVSVYAHEQRKRVPLPLYPFERLRYWLDLPTQTTAPAQEAPAPQTTAPAQELSATPEYKRPQLSKAYVAPRNAVEETLSATWEKIFHIHPIGVDDDFFELGGQSLLAARLLTLVNSACAIDLPMQSIFEAPTIAALARTIERLRQDIPDETTLETSLPDLEAEAVLDAAITPVGAIPFTPDTTPTSILLSGATGFIGAFLLHDLLEQTQATIYCLIRAASSQAASQRIQQQLEASFLWDERYRSRIIPLLGDLSQPLLGLTYERFTWLAEKIDVIYHNGAWVNFFYPYQTLKRTNVLGTQEILRLACQTRVKPVHYVSSIAVFELDDYGETTVGEDVPPRYNRAFQIPKNGYPQSKWVAERLVRTCQERGLPVAIYRPGTIEGHSKTGVANPTDLFYRLLIASLKFHTAPIINTFMDITAVDYVSKAIVHLSKQTSSYGKAFHLVNPSLVSWQEIVHWLTSFGYQLDMVPFKDWHATLTQIAERSGDTQTLTLVQLFSSDAYEDESFSSHAGFRRQASMYTCQNTLKGLQGTFIVCPTVDAEMFGTYLTYLVDKGLVQPPASDTSGDPL